MLSRVVSKAVDVDDMVNDVVESRKDSNRCWTSMRRYKMSRDKLGILGLDLRIRKDGDDAIENDEDDWRDENNDDDLEFNGFDSSGAMI